jgi:hypothetical protein
MKISEYFQLNKTQYELDFVDIDLDSDMPLFIDPYYLGTCDYPWAFDANRTLVNYFSLLLTYLESNQIDKAKSIFVHLNEPNETHLGYSKGIPRGRGVGPTDTKKIFTNLLKSKAVQTGVVEDIEDFRIFVDGVDKDKMSDLTTNIIMKHLIQYTKNQCVLWNIPLTSGVPTSFYWDREEEKWKNSFTKQLIVNNAKILLVPKMIVSYSKEYTPQKYIQHFVLNFLQEDNLKNNTSLVQVKKNKQGKIIRKYVTKDSIKKDLGNISKEYLVHFTEKHPKIFQKFKKKSKENIRNLSNEELTGDLLSQVINHLIKSLDDITPGNDDATIYHRLVVGILELIFYPNLSSPTVEDEIHSGRKRIDITFDNSAESGFFYRLPNSYKLSSQFIFVECKNYSRDLKNPELDQIAGRFGPNRGEVGIIVCRSITKMKLFIKRCSDTYKDNRGLIIPLVDDDLIDMLMNYEKKGIKYCENILSKKFRDIALQ